MTVREMHIEVTQATQQLGANVRRKLRANEIDWVLNRTQDHVIELNSVKRQTTRGFEYDRASIDKLRDIISIVQLPVYGETDDTDNLYTFLPPQYLHSLSSMSEVYQICNGTAPDLHAENYSYYRYKFPQTTKASAPYYTEVIITKNTTEVFRLTTYVASIAESAWTGLNTKGEVFMIRNLVLDRLRALGVNAYWEEFDNLNYPGELIIESFDVYTITVDGTALEVTPFTISRSIYEVRTNNWKYNRLYSSAEVGMLGSTAFSDTYYESPITSISGSRMHILANRSFIVSRQRLTYIRKPRKISLILGQDCELEGMHTDICDLAVEYIQKITGDPNWEVKLQDNISRTNI